MAISHTTVQGAKIFAPCETRCENFAHLKTRCEIHFTVRIKVRKFCTPQSKVRNSFQHAKITVQGANSLNFNFAPCETHSWHTSANSHTSSQFSRSAKQGAKISHGKIQGAKISHDEILSCEISEMTFKLIFTPGTLPNV